MCFAFGAKDDFPHELTIKISIKLNSEKKKKMYCVAGEANQSKIRSLHTQRYVGKTRKDCHLTEGKIREKEEEMTGNKWEGREDQDTAGKGVTWNKHGGER